MKARLIFFGLSLVLFYFVIRQFSELSHIKDLLLGITQPGCCSRWVHKP